MDENFRDEQLCKELMHIPGVKSVILIGSRARGEAKTNSDYDFYVVVPTFFVPVIYKKLKKQERILKDELKSNVSISPMTLLRINRGRDLLLLKTKKEGVTLCGRDYLTKIKVNAIDEILSDELFSYFFSAAYFLIEYFDPDEEISEKCLYNTAKTVMYCAETQLLINGIYDGKRDNIIKEIGQLGLTTNLDILKLAKVIMDDKIPQTANPINFWFSARDYLLQVFSQLTKRYFGSRLDESLEMTIAKLKKTNRSFIKNLQFSILVLMEKGNYHLFSVFTRKSIEKYLWSSLLYLIISTEKDMRINKQYSYNSCQTLESIKLSHKMEDSSSDVDLWREIKREIIEYWPMACGKCVI